MPQLFPTGPAVSHLAISIVTTLAIGCTPSRCAEAPATETPASQTPEGQSPEGQASQGQAAPNEGNAGSETPDNASSVRLYVGSGDWGTATGAVSVFSYDTASGNLTQTSHFAVGGLLSFLATDSKKNFLYAADEGQNKLRSFAISATDGSLTPVATADTIQGMVYVNVTSNDRYILGAEFNSGKTEVFGLEQQGGFTAQVAAVDSGGESHGVFLSPDERFALVPGRASDQVQVFAFDVNTGKLTPHSQVQLPEGAGCRHLDFHPNGQFAYLINEFANTIVAFSYDPSNGALKQLQTISTQPDEGSKSSAADIHVHPSGRFLYGTNRPAGADGSIVVYSIDEAGQLAFVQKESTGGQVPRNFEIVDDGQHIVVGNQESKSIVSFSVDPTTGRLSKQALTEVNVKPFFVGTF